MVRRLRPSGTGARFGRRAPHAVLVLVAALLSVATACVGRSAPSTPAAAGPGAHATGQPAASIAAGPRGAGPGDASSAPSAAGSPSEPSSGASSASSGDAAVAAAAPVTATAVTDPDATITWQACAGGDVAPMAAAGSECARMAVPVAHAAPDGPALSLGLVRLPATDRERRVGSLVVNPGGPGASGVALAEAIAATLDPAVRARYDVVGFDPRGVGSSGGLDCGVGDRLLAPAAASLEGQIGFADALAAACEAEQPSVFPTLSTAAVARDLDAVRAAVGDERLDFLGFSYGSTLGATYAELFPERVGRMVLDGPASPNAPYADWVGTQLTSFQAVLGRFFAACDAQLRCPLHGRTAATWHDLAARADAGGLAAGGGAVLDRDGFLQATTDVLYQGSDSYELLAGLLANAVAGDASGLAELAARDSGISAAAYYGVVCGDDPTRLSTAELRLRIEALRHGAPDFAGGLREVATCGAVRPVGDARPTIGLAPGQITRPLLVATTNDPATPYAGAGALAEALGGAALLTYEGDGHTIVGRGSACVDAAVTAYLTMGALPPDGARCRPVGAVGVVLTAGESGNGAVVSGFSVDSSAQGVLAVGDVVRQVNGQPVTEPMQLERVARSGTRLVLAVDRGGRQLSVTLQPQAPAYWSP